MNRGVNLLLSALVALAGVIAVVLAVHHERQWALTLRNLQRHGVQVRASEVQFEDARRTRGNHVRYRFLPVATPETLPLPATNPDDPLKQMTQMEEWSQKALAYHPWIWGEHRISSALHDAIANHDDRVVTYLPDAPQINAIGKLTDERIASEWQSNPVFTMVAIYAGLVIFVAIARRATAKRQEAS